MYFDPAESNRKKAVARLRDDELVKSGAIGALELSPQNSMFPLKMVHAARIVHDPSRRARKTPSP